MKLEEEVKRFMDNKSKSMITATEYQEKAKTTAIFPANTALEYLSLGLVGEAGEVANKVKKIIRDNKVAGTQQADYLHFSNDIASEIGDVLWYCAMLSDYFQVNLGQIMENNLDKLQSRKSRGVLGGSGDKR